MGVTTGRERKKYQEKIKGIPKQVKNDSSLTTMEAKADKVIDKRNKQLKISRDKFPSETKYVSKVAKPDEGISKEKLKKKYNNDYAKIIEKAGQDNGAWSKVAKIGKGAGLLGLGVGTVDSANKIYNAPDKIVESSKQAGSIGGGAL